MNPSSGVGGNVKILRLLWLIVILAFMCLAVRLGVAVYVARTNGLLHIVSSDKAALLSVGRVNTQAVYVGLGSATVRLSPGVYYVGASRDGKSSLKIVSLKRSVPSTIEIDMEKDSPHISSVEDIGFIGESSLLSSGVTSSQVANLRQLFFKYNQSAKTISITGITPGPRDRNSTSLWFELTFNGRIDQTPYRGRLEYGGFDAVRLTLSDLSGKQLFSGSLPMKPADE
jgi:hypothetical protein